MKNNKELSIIIPCFNEGKTIVNVINDLIFYAKKYSIDIEIIIINDGSNDDTREKSEKLIKKNKFIKLINHNRNLGFGEAYKSGIKKSSGSFCVLIPGDNEADVNDTLRLFCETKNVDMVLPYVVNNFVRSSFRRFLSKLFIRIINISFGTSMIYSNGSVFYRTQVLKRINIKSKGFLFKSEIVLKIIKSNYLYLQTPYFLKQRTDGNAQALKLKNVIQVFFEFITLFIDLRLKKTSKINIIKNSATYVRRKESEKFKV